MTLPSLYVIGDSISILYGPDLESMLADRMSYSRKGGEEAEANLDIPVGANGGDSCRVRECIDALVATGTWRPDWCLFNAGLHDIKVDVETGDMQVPRDKYEANLRAILDAIESVGARPVWANTTPVCDERHNSISTDFARHDRNVVDYNVLADAIMTERGIPTIDLYGLTRALEPDVFCDHVHFTEPVRQVQAAFIAGALEQLVAAHV